ncbi:UNVERIFIED_ORG: hypothetical protein B2H93_14785 [Clostridium botulinum]
MNILEAVKKQTLNEKLRDIANNVIKDIDNKLEKINLERCKCIKVNNDYDKKRKNDYERLLKIRRACNNLEDFELIDIDEFVDLKIDIPIDASIKYGNLKQEKQNPIMNIKKINKEEFMNNMDKNIKAFLEYDERYINFMESNWEYFSENKGFCYIDLDVKLEKCNNYSVIKNSEIQDYIRNKILDDMVKKELEIINKGVI